MHTWSARHAKARFSAMLDACLVEGPQLITRRGIEAAVLLPMDEWHRLQSGAHPSLKELLLAEWARCNTIAPPRARASRRIAAASR
jgi:prevent-host-death family protein